MTWPASRIPDRSIICVTAIPYSTTSRPTTFKRRALDPGAHHPAAVLAPVKERPGSLEPGRTESLPAVLDRRSARWPVQSAGRDGKMIAAEPKDAAQKQGEMPPDQIP